MDRTSSSWISFSWLAPRSKQWRRQQQESLLNYWPGHCLGHKNNFFKINWNPWQLIKITSWNLSCQSLILVWTKRPKAVQGLWFSVSLSVAGTCANLDELGNTDSTMTAHRINFDVSFTLHNNLSFKSIEDKQITLSWQTIKVWQKHDIKPHFLLYMLTCSIPCPLLSIVPS